MAKTRYALQHKASCESIALIEMDDDLLKPEAGIVDPESLTLRPIRNGGMYTIIPVESHTMVTLARLKQSYDCLTTKPSTHMHLFHQRVDELIDTVGLLFNSVDYIVIENVDDMDKLVNPPKGEYTPKKVKYNILGDLLVQLMPEEADNSVPDATEAA